MPGDAVVVGILCKQPNQQGQVLTMGVGKQGRYDRKYYQDFYDYQMDDQVKSFTLASLDGTGAVLVFHSGGAFPGFDESLIMFQKAADKGTQIDINLADYPYSGGSTWANAVGEAVVVHTQREAEFRVSLREQIEPLWQQQALSKLTKGLTADGGLGIGWIPFPKEPDAGSNVLSSQKTYAMLSQNLIWDVPMWPASYKISVWWFLEFYLTKDSKLAGYVPAWSFWTEAGAAEDGAKAIAQCFGQIAALTLNQVLQNQLGQDAKDVYLLPGNQKGTEGVSGNVQVGLADDVTLVLEILK